LGAEPRFGGACAPRPRPQRGAATVERPTHLIRIRDRDVLIASPAQLPQQQQQRRQLPRHRSNILSIVCQLDDNFQTSLSLPTSRTQSPTSTRIPVTFFFALLGSFFRLSMLYRGKREERPVF